MKNSGVCRIWVVLGVCGEHMVIHVSVGVGRSRVGSRRILRLAPGTLHQLVLHKIRIKTTS